MITSADAYKAFQRDTQQHELEIVSADGVHRHLRFKNPKNSACWFEIVTWPGSLCFSGDMGTYTFSRVSDMFTFFRGTPGRINASYWAEKCTSACRTDGIKEFAPERFRAAVIAAFRDYFRGSDVPISKRRECFAELRDEVFRFDEDEHEAMRAACDFSFPLGEFGAFHLVDFWEVNTEAYTFRFLWCLHAIVWGIHRFDAEVERMLRPTCGPGQEKAA